jgi:hypothetical protein
MECSQEAIRLYLCAQLAAEEPSPLGSVFIRKGSPDAGVECYRRLANGDERAWQAKFFASLGYAQWPQLDDSVATALERRPRLVTYIVCVPLDLPDPRLDDRAHAMERWDDRVEKWKGWRRERGMEVTFTYWGQHEPHYRPRRS